MSLKKLNIKTVSELAGLLGVSEGYLRYLANNINHFYRVKEVSKKNSDGFRNFSVPNFKLKKIQKSLNAIIVNNCDLGPYSHYGRKGRSNVTNAISHQNSSEIFTCDLRSFFPSVRPERIYKSLIDEQGCSTEAAKILTRLVSFDFQLPQGAPTSTAIANIVTIRLQRRLGSLAQKFNLRFTILCDDLTFSGDKIPDAFVNLVKEIIGNEGFKIHPKKGGVYNKSKEQVITGINIAHGVTVGKKKKIWKAEHHNDLVEFNLGNMNEMDFEKSKKRYAARKGYALSVKKLKTRNKTIN